MLIRVLAALAIALPALLVGSDAGGQTVGPLITCSRQTPSTPAPAWESKMPAPVPGPVTHRDVQIESADGTLVAARVYLPDMFPGPKPTVVVMSPYHALLGLYAKEAEDARLQEAADCISVFLLARGYAVVLVDMRGTHNSDGCFDYGGRGDQADGYATVRWIAKQSWSNRRVGMYGVSHVGMSQYATAVTSPPELKAIIPIAPITSFWRYLYNGAVHYETNMGTPAAYEFGAAGPPPTNVTDANYVGNVAGAACNTDATLRGMSLNGDMTDYWRERDYSRVADRIKAAVFHVHGTIDQNVKMDHFTSMWKALERAGVPRKALLGPWGHSEPNSTTVRMLEHWHLMALRWFEHWLRHNDSGMMREPTITTISQNGKVRTAKRYPATRSSELVLSPSRSELTSAAGTGTAAYIDVPGFPRPLLMDTDGVRLRYETASLTTGRRLFGEPVLDLVASIDRTDTNFVAHLYDVAPNGSTKLISRGYLDARHRLGFTQSIDVTPDQPLRYRIRLLANDYVLGRGHKLRLLISSSDSCSWLIGGAIGEAMCTSSGVVSDTSIASVTVHEGPGLTTLRVPLGTLSAG